MARDPDHPGLGQRLTDGAASTSARVVARTQATGSATAGSTGSSWRQRATTADRWADSPRS